MRPQLSILIPSIPSRFEKANDLYKKLLLMVENKDVEIIMITDNKVMSIGQKQNHLKSIATGKYFCFIHDDDELLDIEDIYNMTFLDVDVIDFKALCRNDDGSTYVVTQKLNNPVEHKTRKGRYLDCKRPPFPNCVWHNKFKKYDFPDISYSEDWEWVKQCLQEAKSEYFIDKILFSYNFDKNTTEASTETNIYWKNPNGSHS